MITTKQKWTTVGVLGGLLLFFALFGVFMLPKQSNLVYEYAEQLEGKQIGGVKTKMPQASAKIFLNGYFGVNFGTYTEFKDFNTALAALDNRRVPAIWATDVTAAYLSRSGDYRAVYAADVAGRGEERLEFAFAFRKNDTALRDKTDEMFEKFRNNGITEKLYEYFVNGTKNDSLCGLLGKGRTIRVGITGTVPPLEMVDNAGNVSGMAVELAKYLGAYLDMKVKFVVLDNDTAFSQLMAGAVDIIACYGTSENHSTETPQYITSSGYCSMKEYCLLVK